MTLSRLLRPSLLQTGRSALRQQQHQQTTPAVTFLSTGGKAAAASSSTATISPATEHKQWIEQGIMDQDGLVIFDTLHNMQTRACMAYSQRNLFATYSTEAKKFQWMTYAECKFVCRLGFCKGLDSFFDVGCNRWPRMPRLSASRDIRSNGVDLVVSIFIDVSFRPLFSKQTLRRWIR
jgi:hypothetical protein